MAKVKVLHYKGNAMLGTPSKAVNIRYKDTNVSSALDALNTYSTTETLIGEFLGKPLYRRCFTIPSQVNIPSDSYDTLLDVNADYIKRLVRADIISSDDSTPKICNEFLVIYSKTYHTFRALSFRHNISGIAANSILVIEYTKTTD